MRKRGAGGLAPSGLLQQTAGHAPRRIKKGQAIRLPFSVRRAIRR